MDETINAIANNAVEPTVVPNAGGTTAEVAPGVENQSEAKIAEMQAEMDGLDKYIASKGGEEKVREFITKFEEKKALVEQHKNATKENSTLVWSERADEVISQSAQNTQTQTAPQGLNKAYVDEMNRMILKDLAGQFSNIGGSIEDGSLLKEAAAQGFQVVQNGMVNRAALTQYAEFASQRFTYQNAPSPSSDPQPAVEVPDYERVEKGQMTVAKAIQVVRESEANVAAGKAAHPDIEAARLALQTGRTV